MSASRLFILSVLGALALAAAGAGPAAACPIEGPCNQGPEPPPPPPPVAHLSLSVVSHLSSATPKASDVSTWTIKLDACASTPAYDGFRWPAGTTPGEQPCIHYATQDISQPSYTAAVTAVDDSGESAASARIDNPGRYLIASLGDSFASGEGNPDTPQQFSPTLSAAARWSDEPCHRSPNAAPALVARDVDALDAKPVTFLHLACSGASLSDRGSGSATDGGGVLSPYTGVAGDARIPAQIDALDALTDRPKDDGHYKIDALLLSAGGNDIGFGHIIEDCMIPLDKCQARENARLFGRSGALATLASRFDELGEALDRLNVAPENVYVTEYPDPMPNAAGTWSDLPEFFVGFSQDEAAWASQTVMPALNTTIRNAAAKWGWTYVGGVASQFRGAGFGHGIAAGPQRWINTFADSAINQGPVGWWCTKAMLLADEPVCLGTAYDTKGVMHPNALGQAAYERAILAQLARPLGAVNGTQHAAYVSGGDVIEAHRVNSQRQWVSGDLTPDPNAPEAQAGQLTSWSDAGSQHIAYLDFLGRVHELYRGGSGQWWEHDLTAAVGGPPAAAGSLTSWIDKSYEHIVYVAQDGHVHELYFPLAGGGWVDGQLYAGNVRPRTLTSWVDATYQHVAFATIDGHLHELAFKLGAGPWVETDITPAGAAVAPAGRLASWVEPHAQLLAYVDTGGHVRQLSRIAPIGQWRSDDLTAVAAAPAAQPDALAGWGDTGSRHVVYVDLNGHVRDLNAVYDRGGDWSADDLTAATGAAAAVTGSLSSWRAAGVPHVAFMGSDGHAHELSDPPGGTWSAADLTGDSPPAAVPSATTGWTTGA
jgi:hypothetical protein